MTRLSALGAVVGSAILHHPCRTLRGWKDWDPRFASPQHVARQATGAAAIIIESPRSFQSVLRVTRGMGPCGHTSPSALPCMDECPRAEGYPEFGTGVIRQTWALQN